MPCRSRAVNATGWRRRKSGSDAVASPSSRHCRHDYVKNGGGMWPQCGAARSQPSFLPKACQAHAIPAPVPARIAALRRSTGIISAAKRLTISGAEDYIPSSWARRRLARWRVCEAPHCSHGDRASGHEGVAMFASARRMCGVWCVGRLRKQRSKTGSRDSGLFDR
jgi:hypothetical protein